MKNTLAGTRVTKVATLLALLVMAGGRAFATDPVPDWLTMIFPTIVPKAGHSGDIPLDRRANHIKTMYEDTFESYWRETSYHNYDPVTGARVRGFFNDSRTFNYIPVPWAIYPRGDFGPPESEDGTAVSDFGGLRRHSVRPDGSLTYIPDSADADGVWTSGESFHDLNGNGIYDTYSYNRTYRPAEDRWNSDNNLARVQLRDAGGAALGDLFFPGNRRIAPLNDGGYSFTGGELYADYNDSVDLANDDPGYDPSVTIYVAAGGVQTAVPLNELDLTPLDPVSVLEGDLAHAVVVDANPAEGPNPPNRPLGGVPPGDIARNGVLDYTTAINDAVQIVPALFTTGINAFTTYPSYVRSDVQPDADGFYRYEHTWKGTGVPPVANTDPALGPVETWTYEIKTIRVEVYQAQELYGVNKFNTPNGNAYGDDPGNERTQVEDNAWTPALEVITEVFAEPFEDFLSWFDDKLGVMTWLSEVPPNAPTTLTNGTHVIFNPSIQAGNMVDGLGINTRGRAPAGALTWAEYERYIRWNYPGDANALLARAFNGQYDGAEGYGTTAGYKLNPVAMADFITMEPIWSAGPPVDDPTLFNHWDNRFYATWQDWWVDAFGAPTAFIEMDGGGLPILDPAGNPIPQYDRGGVPYTIDLDLITGRAIPVLDGLGDPVYETGAGGVVGLDAFGQPIPLYQGIPDGNLVLNPLTDMAQQVGALLPATAPLEWEMTVYDAETFLAEDGPDENNWIPATSWAYSGSREFCDLPSSIYHLRDGVGAFVQGAGRDPLTGYLGGDEAFGEVTSPFNDAIYGNDLWTATITGGSRDTADGLITPASPFAFQIQGTFGSDGGNVATLEYMTWRRDGDPLVDVHPQEFRDRNLDGRMDTGYIRFGEPGYSDETKRDGTGPYPFNRERFMEDVIEIWDYSEDFASHTNRLTGARIPIYGFPIYLPAVTTPGANPDDEPVEQEGWGALGGPAGANTTVLTRDDLDPYPIVFQVRPQDGATIGGADGLEPSAPADIAGSSFGMGLLCHEQAHDILGLPDLYDYDVSSEGELINNPIGGYDLMAGGMVHGVADMKAAAGWTALTNLNTSIPVNAEPVWVSMYPVERYPDNYFRYSNSALPGEYIDLWYTENNTRFGVPGGAGVYIAIQDKGANPNALPRQQRVGNHYIWQIIQADGLQQLEDNANNGDGGDPFPGSTGNDLFTEFTTPAARWYDGKPMGLRIYDIILPTAFGEPARVLIANINPLLPFYADPNGPDLDGDGIPDSWEFYHFGRRDIVNATSDYDGDGVNDLNEYWAQTNPRLQDTDLDGSPDRMEDPDNDGLNNLREQEMGTHPMLPDTDDNGVIDSDASDADPLDALTPLIDRVLSLGGTGYVEVPENADRRFGLDSFTIQAWVQPSVLGGTIIQREVRAGALNYALRVLPTGQIELRFTPTDFSADVVLMSPSAQALALGEWAHVAGTFNAGTGRLSIHLNGVQVATLVTTRRPATFSVGPLQTRLGVGFTGLLDEAAFFNTPLSASTIAATMEGVAIDTPTGLVSYYRFDDGTSATGPNATGYWFGTSGRTDWYKGQVQDFAAGFEQDWLTDWVNSGTLRFAAAIVPASDEAPVRFNNGDTNGDGIEDWWYLDQGLDPAGPSVADEDWDNDGVPNYWEFRLNSDPNNAYSLDPTGQLDDGEWDADGDGMSSVEEIERWGSDPSEWDSDDDGYSDGEEVSPLFDDLDYGFSAMVTSPLYSRSPLISRSLILGGKQMEAPFSRRFSFLTATGLEEAPVVTITAPADGADVAVRFVTLTGTVTSDSGIQSVQLFNNGDYVRDLALDGSGAFSSTIIIRAGVNLLEVVAVDDVGLSGRDSVQINGTFQQADIRVTQTWTSPGDLDTWLIDPQGRHMGWTTGGPGYPDNVDEEIPNALLDIDDTQGMGPENITIVKGNAVAGEYEVWMNNFSHSGNPQSTVRILVLEGEQGEQYVEFGPQSMPVSDGNGDDPDAWWHVTTISWPSGIMNPPGRPVTQEDDSQDPGTGVTSTEGWTIEAWVRPMDNNQNGAIATYTLPDGRICYEVGMEANRPFIRVQTTGGQWYRAQAAALPANEWAHLAFVYGDTDQTLRVHINGTLAVAQHMPVAALIDYGRFVVDGPLAGGATFSACYLDELRVWSRARHGGLISDNMHKPLNKVASMVACYPFDDGGLGIEDVVAPLNRDYDLASPRPDVMTDAKPGADGLWGTADDIAAGPGADGHNDDVTAIIYAPVFGEVDDDADGMPNWWEALYFDTSIIAAATGDNDADGLNNLYEFWARTNPFDSDSNTNGILDRDEDPDVDGLVNGQEQVRGSHPRLADTDDDGRPDALDSDPADALTPRTGRVLKLDGSASSFVEMPKQPRFRLSSFTVQAWVNPTVGGGDILARQVESGVFNYILRLTADRRPEIVFTPGDRTANIVLTAPVAKTLFAGTWAHVAGTFNETQGRLSLFIDGVQVATTTTVKRPATNGVGPERIRVGAGFNGLLDEVAISATALTSTTLTSMMPGIGDRLSTALVSYYRFDDATSALGPDGAGFWFGTSDEASWWQGQVQEFAPGFGQDWLNAWRNGGTLRGNAAAELAGADAPVNPIDGDGDGLPDDWEEDNDLDPNDPDGDQGPDGDPDGDGLTNKNEWIVGTDPQNPDSDGDGVWDSGEDFDGDGLTNLFEQNQSLTMLNRADTDDDTFSDGVEVTGLPTSDPLNSLSPKKNLAAYFDGAGRMLIPDQTRHTLSSWTVAAWVRPEALAEGIVLRRQIEATVAGGLFKGVNYELGVKQDGGIRAYAKYVGLDGSGLPKTVIVDGTGAAEIQGNVDSSTLIPAGEWTHLVATYDELEHRLTLYINGEMAVYRTDAMPIEGLGIREKIAYPGLTTVGGGELVGPLVENGFEGHIDNVIIRNGAISMAQMQDFAMPSYASKQALAVAGEVALTGVTAPEWSATAVALSIPHKDELLVRFKTGVSATQINTLLQQRNLNTIRTYKTLPVRLIGLKAGVTMAQALTLLRADPTVEYAEPNYLRSPSALTLPTDPLFANQWALHNTGQGFSGWFGDGTWATATGGTVDADMDAPEAWTRSLGDRRIVVAVIDSGVNVGHPDLAPNIWVNAGEVPGDDIDNDGNGYVDDVNGYNFGTGTADNLGDFTIQHGSHVAGIIGAVQNNGIGISGVCPKVQIMVCKAIDEAAGGFPDSALIEAIEYARANGARVANMSLGGLGYSKALEDAFRAARASDILFAIAAGNETYDIDMTPSFPAAHDVSNIITVAATDNKDELATFSNWGASSVDIAAPGVDILSTYSLGDAALFTATYFFESGTSMAAPQVAGAAALILAVNPGLSAQQVRQVLMNSVDRVPALEGKVVSNGRLNLAKAVAGAGSLLGLFIFDDGGQTVEDFSVAKDWLIDWAHAGVLQGTAALVLSQVPEDMVDSDGDGLPDWWEIEHNLDPYDATGENGGFGDPDGDGLDNRGEYWAGTDPWDWDSNDDGLSDYDTPYPSGEHTFGELHDDGDRMPALWEEQFGGALDPLVYDGAADMDHDGWSSFAEYMFSGVTNAPAQQGGAATVGDFRSTDPTDSSQYPTPSVRFKFLLEGSGVAGDLVVMAYTNAAMSTAPVAVATFAPASLTFPQTIQVNSFVDLGGDVQLGESAYDADLPQFTTGHLVEGVTWFLAFFDADGDGAWGEQEFGGVANSAVRMGWQGAPEVEIGLTRTLPGYGRFAWAAVAGATSYTVSVTRTTTDGAPMIIANAVVAQPFFCEGQERAYYFYGLPLGGSASPRYEWYVRNSANGTVNSQGAFNLKAPDLPVPTPLTADSSVIYDARPVLSWTMSTNSTAYRLVIRPGSPAAAPIFDGTYARPFVDAAGAVKVALPIYAGDGSFADGQVYYWEVQQGNGRTASAFSAPRWFRLQLAAAPQGYFSIAGEVQYWGKARMNAGSAYIVQAFTSKGFSGRPAAQTSLNDKGAFTLRGLRAGTYYLRAFLDQQRNGQLDPFESWGFMPQAPFGNPVNVGEVTLTGNVTGKKIVVRDRDTDNDQLPDAWEYSLWGNLTSANWLTDSDGDGLTDLEEYKASALDSDPLSPDTDGDTLDDYFEIMYGEMMSKYPMAFSYDPYNPTTGLGTDLNVLEDDTDGDGYTDYDELFVYFTNPVDPENFPGSVRARQLLDLTGDHDGDGILNIVEYVLGEMTAQGVMDVIGEQSVVAGLTQDAVSFVVRGPRFADIQVSLEGTTDLSAGYQPIAGSSVDVLMGNSEVPITIRHTHTAGQIWYYRINWKLP